MLLLFSDDIERWEVGSPTRTHGKREFRERVLPAPDVVKFTNRIDRLIEEGNVVVAEGDAAIIRADESATRVRHCDVFEFEGEKIKRIVAYGSLVGGRWPRVRPILAVYRSAPMRMDSIGFRLKIPDLMRRFMAAYMVFTRERMRDPVEYEVYKQRNRLAMEGHQIKKLALYGPHKVLEGPDVQGVVILEFPTIADAERYYNSPAYREAREHRFRAADYRVLLVEGTTPP